MELPTLVYYVVLLSKYYKRLVSGEHKKLLQRFNKALKALKSFGTIAIVL